ncbi:MAG: phosphoribosylamine--glycine ligase [Acidobacteria bacterium]|nr:MAG: phosphoribosylamine--glycine ligase [Acidobacteriota bacterium]
MNILVLGSGGREHALVWKLRESQLTDEIFCAPGNAGIAQTAECFPVDLTDPAAMLQLATELKADLTVAGPEAPLVAGAVDEFEQAGRKIVGPTKLAAQLEGSKIFAKEFMKRHAIPTARFRVVEDYSSGEEAVANLGLPVVIKADGLAAGKGVVVARTRGEAEKALGDFLVRKLLGGAGERVVVEECLMGEELSFIILAGKRGWLPLVPAQDHKAAFDNDLGPNTGGMGAYSEDSILPDRLRQDIIRNVVEPSLAGMAADGMPYQGFLYCGLMLTAEGPRVLEYNVRLGDPEAQPIMMRLRSDLCEMLMASLDGQLTAIGARWSPNPSVCVVLASRGYPGKIETGKEITGIEAAESLGGVKVFHAGTVFRDHQLLTSGGRVLGVTAIAEDLPTTIEQAYAGVDKVHFDGMHYRRDIGAKGLRRLKVTGEIHHPDNQAGNPPPA